MYKLKLKLKKKKKKNDVRHTYFMLGLGTMSALLSSDLEARLQILHSYHTQKSET